MKQEKERQARKDFLDQKIKEIRAKFDLIEMIELGIGEGVVLDVGDYIAGTYCGITDVASAGGRDKVILVQSDEYGLVSLRSSVTLGQHLISIKPGTWICILCYASEPVEDHPGQSYKLFKVYGKKESK